MVDLSEAKLAALAVHKVGNKLHNEGFIASPTLFDLNEEIGPILEDYFLSPFKKHDYFWQFTHETDLSLNEVYTYSTAIFDSKRAGLLAHSVSILKHLYAQSTHPNIKPGELYVALFTGCFIDEVMMDAVGIFKSENKDVYLRPDATEEAVSLTHEQGINVKKLDKGALIFNTFGDDGYSLFIHDTNSQEAQYWMDDFMHVQRIQDDSFHTEGYINLCADFVEEVYATEPKKEQVIFMNNSLSYFSQAKEFDPEEFEMTVLPLQEGYKELFKNYREKYEETHELSGEEGFVVSRQAVREARRRFKDRIKLDTGIEIRIPSKADTDYIERGFDEKLQMGYYKVYFHKEE